LAALVARAARWCDVAAVGARVGSGGGRERRLGGGVFDAGLWLSGSGEGIDHEREADEVQVLALVADTVCSS
jgi:hypothetical protein